MEWNRVESNRIESNTTEKEGLLWDWRDDFINAARLYDVCGQAETRTSTSTSNSATSQTKKKCWKCARGVRVTAGIY